MGIARPRSAIISTRSRRLSLNRRYQRTHRMMTSRSKCRPAYSFSRSSSLPIVDFSRSGASIATDRHRLHHSSFFLVSTEMTGSPAAWNAFTSALMCSNCALRSGWPVPSRVFALACRLKPRRFSSRPTSFWPARKPKSASAADRWRWLLLTHSKAASGSPRTADCTKSFKVSRGPGCVSVAGLPPRAEHHRARTQVFQAAINRAARNPRRPR